jgi:ESCRT-II complex subunit VPS22
MCLSAGADPLSSNKGFWSDLLGVGDFYFELAVKIIQITVSTRSSNGGLISSTEMVSKLQQNSTSGTTITLEDVHKAIEKISVLGNGFRLVRISNASMILSVPLEITTDHQTIIAAASENGSFVNVEDSISLLGWTSERFLHVINLLLQEGMIWIDDVPGKFMHFVCLKL